MHASGLLLGVRIYAYSAGSCQTTEDNWHYSLVSTSDGYITAYVNGRPLRRLTHSLLNHGVLQRV